MKKLTLAVLAAGMGSRFGGLKQTEKMDGKGHILLDYSLHDAILADFERVVFIIRKEMKDAFLSLVTSRRWYDRVDVELAFQELSDIPPEFSLRLYFSDYSLKLQWLWRSLLRFHIPAGQKNEPLSSYEEHLLQNDG